VLPNIDRGVDGGSSHVRVIETGAHSDSHFIETVVLPLLWVLTEWRHQANVLCTTELQLVLGGNRTRTWSAIHGLCPAVEGSRCRAFSPSIVSSVEGAVHVGRADSTRWSSTHDVHGRTQSRARISRHAFSSATGPALLFTAAVRPPAVCLCAQFTFASLTAFGRGGRRHGGLHSRLGSPPPAPTPPSVPPSSSSHHIQHPQHVAHYSRSPKNPLLQLLQNSSESASAGS